MSNKNADQILIPLGGEFLLAETTVDVPTTLAEVLAILAEPNEDWDGLGWASEEGAKITQARDVLEIPAWGSNGLPVKKKVTKRTFTFGGTLLQSNRMNVTNWFGATDFAADGATPAGGFRADIEVDTPIVERALLVHWKLEGYDMAIPFRKVDLSSDGDLTVVDSDAQKYGYTMTSMVPDSGDILGHLLTNHPAFDPAG